MRTLILYLKYKTLIIADKTQVKKLRNMQMTFQTHETHKTNHIFGSSICGGVCAWGGG